MRVILALMWGVALFAIWSAPAGWSADKQGRQPPKNWPYRVEGLGSDMDRARDDAIEKAREEIIKRLQICKPPILAWQPSADFIQHSLVKSAEAGEDLVVSGKEYKRCVLELKKADWDLFHRLDEKEQIALRHHRGELRMLTLAKVLAGLMLFLAAAIVYVRVDDWTQGYYTRWLQVAGASLVVGLGTSWWLLS
jgi:hypothetical protein